MGRSKLRALDDSAAACGLRTICGSGFVWGAVTKTVHFVFRSRAVSARPDRGAGVSIVQTSLWLLNRADTARLRSSFGVYGERSTSIAWMRTPPRQSKPIRSQRFRWPAGIERQLPAVAASAVNAPAANDVILGISIGRAGGVDRVRLRCFIVQVGHEFAGVAEHVVHAPGVGQFLANGVDLPFGVSAGPGDFIEVGICWPLLP